MIATKPSGDPRLEAMFGLDSVEKAGVRPVIPRPSGGLSGPALAIIAAVAALMLFWVLESRRQAAAEPPVRPRAADNLPMSAEPPPLYVPPVAAQPAYPPLIVQRVADAAVPQQPVQVRVVPRAATQTVSQPVQQYSAPPLPPVSAGAGPAFAPARTSSGPALVMDGGGSPAAPARAPDQQAEGQSAGDEGGLMGGRRMRASALANLSHTVPQGVLIPAVLETAFDSTRPGFARAIVSRNIRSFDGRNILIPRGSRLIGEYKAETAPGQKRAVIGWTRLIRPDGVTIALDSPSADPLGRGGIAAGVNSHFWERFGNALLQSTINLGSTVATRAANGPVVVALPGAVQSSVAPALGSTGYVPTLVVPRGKSISVFVAHDLDFGPAEGNP